MPDTVVPVVRRPVRRVSATPDPKELSSGDPPNWNGALAVVCVFSEDYIINKS